MQAGWPRGFLAWSEGVAAWALADVGAKDEAEAVTRRLLQEPEGSHAWAGFSLVLLGRHDEGFTLLAGISEWLVDHVLFFVDQHEAVRADLRCTELLRKLGATESFQSLRRVKTQAK